MDKNDNREINLDNIDEYEYREIQLAAMERDIKGNQSREELIRLIKEHEKKVNVEEELDEEMSELFKKFMKSGLSKDESLEIIDDIGHEYKNKELKLKDLFSKKYKSLISAVKNKIDKKPEEITKVECPNCHEKVQVYETKKGRYFIASSGGIAGVIGVKSLGGLGLVGSFGGLVFTPIAMVIAFLILAGFGYFVGKNKLDDIFCPECDEELNLGL